MMTTARPHIDQIDAARHRLHVLREAVAIQKRHVADVESKRSRELCEQFRPEHRKIVHAVAEAVAAVAKANEAERQFFEQFDQDPGIRTTSTLVAMPFMGAGRLRDPHSRARMYLKEARDRGFLDSVDYARLIHPFTDET